MADHTEQLLNEILAELKYQRAVKELSDVWIQYPNNLQEESFPANTTRTIIQKRVGRNLKSISVSVPANANIVIKNDGVQQFYFSNQSGYQEFTNGIPIGDIEIIVSNLAASAQVISYQLTFV